MALGTTIESLGRRAFIQRMELRGFHVYLGRRRLGTVRSLIEITRSLLTTFNNLSSRHPKSYYHLGGPRILGLEGTVCQVGLNMMMVSGEERAGSAGPNVIRSVADAVFSIIPSLQDVTYDFRTIQRRYNRDLELQISAGQLPRLTEETYREAVDLLIHEKRVIESNGRLSRYDQELLIAEMTRRFTNGTRGATTRLHDIAARVQECSLGVFGTVDLYLKTREGDLKIVSGARADIERSNFRDWQPLSNEEARGGLFASMAKPNGTKFLHIPDISQDARVPAEDRSKYVREYGEDKTTEAIFGFRDIDGGASGAAFRLHEWRTGQVLYSPNARVSAINDGLDFFMKTVAGRIQEIVSARPDLSLKEMWELEERQARSSRQAFKATTPPSAARVAAQPGSAASQDPSRYLPESQLIHVARKDGNNIRRAFTFEIIQNPSQAIPQERHDAVIDDLTGAFIDSLTGKIKGKIDKARIRVVVADAYFKPATHLAVIREGGKVVGFSALASYAVDGEQIVRITATYLGRNAEKFRFSGRINYYLFGVVLRELGRRFKFVTRTANPAAFGALMGAANHFPQPSNSKAVPTPDAVRVTKTISTATDADVAFEESTFLSPKAFKHAFGFVYDKGEVDLHSDARVNEHMMAGLNYDEGDAFWVYGEISSFVLRMFIVRDVWKQLKKWFERLRNRLSRTVVLH